MPRATRPTIADRGRRTSRCPGGLFAAVAAGAVLLVGLTATSVTVMPTGAHAAGAPCGGAHCPPTTVAVAAPVITSVSPTFGPPGTTIVIDGSYLNLVSELIIGGVDVNEVPASELQYGPGFYLRSDHVIVASTPSPKYSGSAVSVTGTDTAGNTVATSATYTYPIGLLSMTSPLPYTPGQIGDQTWANGQGRSLSLYPDKQLQFTTSAPLFHIATSLVDDSDTYPENPPSSHQAPYAIGNEGQYTAVLEMCALPGQASPSTTPSTYPGGPCTNWDRNTGYWVDAGSVDGLPIEQHSTLIANGSTAIGDIALPTTGLFDQQNYARTFRVYAFVTETDTHTALLGDQRSDDTLSAPFAAVVSPEALVQLNVLPYTILYQPPGDMSTVSYAVGSNYGTTFTLGNSNTKTETGTTEESSSLKFSEALLFSPATRSAARGLSTTRTPKVMELPVTRAQR